MRHIPGTMDKCSICGQTIIANAKGVWMHEKQQPHPATLDRIIDVSKKIRYQCPVTVRCNKTLEIIPHHGAPTGLLLISVDGRYVESIPLPEAAFLALWGAMSEYQVDRASTEEEEETDE